MKTKTSTLALCLCAAGFLNGQPIGEREALTGDWGGKRSAWEDKGYTFTLEYHAETFNNVSGGAKTGGVYQGLGYAAIDADADKAWGLANTTFRVSGLWTRGNSPGNYAGDELTVSNMDAYNSVRLYETYLETALGKANVRLGYLLADEEFSGTEYGEAFINAAFGQPAYWAANTLNTGPAFNVPGLGIRLRYDFTDAWYAQAGIYDGDTFDSASGDASVNKDGFHFELGNGQGWTSLYEVGYNEFNLEGVNLPGFYRVGAWHHTADFAKNAGGNGDSNWGIYGIIDQMVYREPGQKGDQGLGVFVRGGYSPPDRNRFQTIVDTGVSYTGLIPGRDEDVAALGIVWGRHSSSAASPGSHETAVEVTYIYQLTPAIYVQPDIQWINRPSGDSSVGDAWLLGVRVGFTF